MIFDIAGILITATLFALSVAVAYRLGERERKKEREKEGWEEILSYRRSREVKDEKRA